jgi:hypothetical protein
LVIGILSTLGGIIQIINGCPNFAGLIWVVLGAFYEVGQIKRKKKIRKNCGNKGNRRNNKEAGA